MKLTLIVFAFSLITSAAFAGEGWNKTKTTVKKEVKEVEQGTKNMFHKDKQKMEEKKEKKEIKSKEKEKQHQHKYE